MINYNLRISTNIRLHPEFLKEPTKFARHHKVDLVDDVFRETDFENASDSKYPHSKEKIQKLKANIHLVRHGAIRLFAESEDEVDWVRSIELDPSLLRYSIKRHPLTPDDLLAALSVLRSQVAPLLANPLDARHVVPGLKTDGDSIAYWSRIESEIRIPGILLPCLHGLSHPGTGPADGTSKTRIQFGDRNDERVIQIESAKWEASGPSETETVQGIRLKLFLKDHALPTAFGQLGRTALVKNTKRLITFPLSSVAHVHRTVMARMEGSCLPIPDEWRNPEEGKPVTHAKAIALVSQLTPIPIEEIRAMDEELRHISSSTRKRLNNDVPKEAARLKPEPVTKLFTPELYAPQRAGMTPVATGEIDPLIAAAYGER